MGQISTGGWSPISPKLSDDAQKVFDTVFGKMVGVKYEPVAFSKQVVNGINYRYLCNATGIYPGAETKHVVVIIHQPIQGEPHLESIEPLK
jgi:hypothetical protein